MLSSPKFIDSICTAQQYLRVFCTQLVGLHVALGLLIFAGYIGYLNDDGELVGGMSLNSTKRQKHAHNTSVHTESSSRNDFPVLLGSVLR